MGTPYWNNPSWGGMVGDGAIAILSACLLAAAAIYVMTQVVTLKWIWRRGQQVFGAAVATASVGVFLVCIVWGCLPGDLGRDLPEAKRAGSYQLSAHDPRIDDGQIKKAIARCYASSITSSPTFKALREEYEKRVRKRIGSGFADQSAKDQNGMTDPDYMRGVLDKPEDAVLTSLVFWSDLPFEQYVDFFEFSAIADSERLLADRLRFDDGTRIKQERIRINQIRVLLLSAAASFLIGIKTLLSDNKPGVPFPSIMNGAWLPISVAALLVPVVATVYSGIIAYDDDGRTALRYARALAQLEQLHSRIVLDVAGDPYLCRLEELYADIPGGQKRLGSSEPVLPADSNEVVPESVDAGSRPSRLTQSQAACLLNRAEKVEAWEQRYEQISNDASNALAQAGDLKRGNAKSPDNSLQVAALDPDSGADPCIAATVQKSSATQPATPVKSAATHAAQEQARNSPGFNR
jgi:hypothetical protein